MAEKYFQPTLEIQTEIQIISYNSSGPLNWSLNSMVFFQMTYATLLPWQISANACGDLQMYVMICKCAFQAIQSYQQ